MQYLLLYDGESAELLRLHRDNTADDDGDGDVCPVWVGEVFPALSFSDNCFTISEAIPVALAWQDVLKGDVWSSWDAESSGSEVARRSASSDTRASLPASVTSHSTLGASETGSPRNRSLQRISVISNGRMNHPTTQYRLAAASAVASTWLQFCRLFTRAHCLHDLQATTRKDQRQSRKTNRKPWQDANQIINSALRVRCKHNKRAIEISTVTLF